MSAKKQMLFDIFVTAMEGGIGYWSVCTAYHWELPNEDEDLDGFYADILIDPEEGGLTFLPSVKISTVKGSDNYGDDMDYLQIRIDKGVLARGYDLAARRTEQENRHQWQCGNGRPPLVVTDDTYWDFDSIDADAIVQLGLFGTTVYG